MGKFTLIQQQVDSEKKQYICSILMYRERMLDSLMSFDYVRFWFDSGLQNDLSFWLLQTKNAGMTLNVMQNVHLSAP